MTEIERIQDQLRRTFSGDAWHGASLAELLDGVSPAQALARPIPTAHTMLELVRHLTVWRRLVTARLKGDARARVTSDQDWVAGGEPRDWTDALEELERSQVELLAASAKVTEADLDRPAPGSDTTYYGLLHGVIQHDLYHAGQIGILRKALHIRPE